MIPERHTDHDRILCMIETMQRNGHTEQEIHDQVRRMTGADRSRSGRRPTRRDPFRLFRRRERRRSVQGERRAATTARRDDAPKPDGP
jgi:hypothetical protein